MNPATGSTRNNAVMARNNAVMARNNAVMAQRTAPRTTHGAPGAVRRGPTRRVIPVLVAAAAISLSGCSSQDRLVIANPCEQAIQVFTGWEDHASVIVEARATAEVSGFWDEGATLRLPAVDVEFPAVKVSDGPGDSYEAGIPVEVCGPGADRTVDVVVARTLADGDFRVDIHTYGNTSETAASAILARASVTTASTAVNPALERVRIEVPVDVDVDALIAAARDLHAGSVLYDCRSYPCSYES